MLISDTAKTEELMRIRREAYENAAQKGNLTNPYSKDSEPEKRAAIEHGISDFWTHFDCIR